MPLRLANPVSMHAPASVPGARRRLALPAALRRRPKLPGGRQTAIVAASIAGLLLILGLILVFTPIAHPRTLNVEGVTGPSEARITSLLEDAASKESTFAVSEKTLMRAVAAYPEVAGVEIHSHPPFRLDVRAIMRLPVARIDVAGRAFVVAGDGTILQRAVEADVPKLDASAGNTAVRDGRIAGARAALAILAAAPEPLLEIARTVRAGHAGIEVEMARGPRLVFGTADQAGDKWAAAAAVIADGSADAATYIDVRVPSRPAVGGLGGTQSAASTDPPQLTATTNTTLGAGATGATSATGAATSGSTGAAPATGTAGGTTSAAATTGGAASAGTSSAAPSTSSASGAAATSGSGTPSSTGASTGTATSGTPATGGGAAITATP